MVRVAVLPDGLGGKGRLSCATASGAKVAASVRVRTTAKAPDLSFI